ncbi:MAG: cytochrome c [Planctomycetota bacterium]
MVFFYLQNFMMPIKARQILLFLLILIFLFQTYLVYFDETGRKTLPFSSVASQGQKLWHQYNCQSCHQIYGFGGFLGPDLTNSAQTLASARFESILTVGSIQMPAFHFSSEDRLALLQFLTEVNQTGVSQTKARKYPLPAELLTKIIQEQENPLSISENLGKEILFREGCLDCHLPNIQSRYWASDLTRITQKLRTERILETLATGIPGQGMPSFKFSTQEKSDLLDFLTWLQKKQDRIQKEFSQQPSQKESISIPWFEYEK